VVLAAEMSEKIVTIHPFIDGNGRTSRLWMNLILLKHGYVIANIKGDHSNRLCYYDALEMARVDIKKNSFIEFIAKVELEALKRYLNILGA
jgi:Fic family protein